MRGSELIDWAYIAQAANDILASHYRTKDRRGQLGPKFQSYLNKRLEQWSPEHRRCFEIRLNESHFAPAIIDAMEKGDRNISPKYRIQVIPQGLNSSETIVTYLQEAILELSDLRNKQLQDISDNLARDHKRIMDSGYRYVPQSNDGQTPSKKKDNEEQVNSAPLPPPKSTVTETEGAQKTTTAYDLPPESKKEAALPVDVKPDRFTTPPSSPRASISQEVGRHQDSLTEESEANKPDGWELL